VGNVGERAPEKDTAKGKGSHLLLGDVRGNSLRHKSNWGGTIPARGGKGEPAAGTSIRVRGGSGGKKRHLNRGGNSLYPIVRTRKRAMRRRFSSRFREEKRCLKGGNCDARSLGGYSSLINPCL